MSLCEYVHVSVGDLWYQKKVSDPLELELKAFVSCWTGVVVVELRS